MSETHQGPICPSCNYLLRGLPLRGKCPECGKHYTLSLPGLEPGAIPPSSRYQRFAYDQSLNKAATLRAFICTIACVGIIAAWKLNDKGSAEALGFFARYGITLVAALGIYTVCCFGIFDYCGPLSRAIFGVAGALAASLLTQFLIAEVPTVLTLSIAWFFAFAVFLGVAASFLDLDIQEAGLFAIFILGIRVILKFALFDQMFAK